MFLRLLLSVEPSALQTRLRRLLRGDDVLVKKCPANAASLLVELGRESYDLVVASRAMLGPDDGYDVVVSINSLPERPEIVVLSEDEDSEDRSRLLALGCLMVLHTRVASKVLGEALGAVLSRQRKTITHTIVANRGVGEPSLSDFVSASPAMQSFINVARRVTASDASLLILGETGVGKERLARAIHAEGPRSAAPFIAINCGALPDTLLESELFGHEEGAFTGASRARRGWFELSHGGTIFLDEIGEIPLHLQVKLLHVLQNHVVQRLGSEQSIEVDVRVMAATNRELLAEIEEGKFRRDLYYRLAVINLLIPPLRERREDIPALVDDYISRFRMTIGRDVRSIDDNARKTLVEYSWPGNVRELINVIERAVLLCERDSISLEDLPESIAETGHSRKDQSGISMLPQDANSQFPAQWLELPIREARKAFVVAFERLYLTRLLRLTNGRVGEAARMAGIDSRSLFEKMRQVGLRKEEFRGGATSPKSGQPPNSQ
jgi:DNA-binding NtrC family response regulator